MALSIQQHDFFLHLYFSVLHQQAMDERNELSSHPSL